MGGQCCNDIHGNSWCIVSRIYYIHKHIIVDSLNYNSYLYYMKKETVKIYYYMVDGVRYYTPNVLFAHARAEANSSDVYYETYEVDAIEEKK